MARARIVVCDDEMLIRMWLVEHLSDADYRVDDVADGAALEAALRTEPADLVLLDLRLPDVSGLDLLPRVKAIDPLLPVIMMTAYGEVETAVAAVRAGAHHFLEKPIALPELLLLIEQALAARRLRSEVDRYREGYRWQFADISLVGRSPALRRIAELITRVGARGSPVNILLRGAAREGRGGARHTRARTPSGAPLRERQLHVAAGTTGRERAVRPRAGRVHGRAGAQAGTRGDRAPGHRLSRRNRRHAQAHAVEGPALPRDARVPASGRRAEHRGRCSRHRGNEPQPRGSRRPRRFPRGSVLSPKCRPDSAAALRDRPEDIGPLAVHLVDSLCRELRMAPREIHPEALLALEGYSWPGNARELRNVLERILLLEESACIGVEHLPAELRAASAMKAKGFVLPPSGIDLEALERDLMCQAMERADGNKTNAARLLCLSRDTLRYRLEKYGI
jgi:DNA-binding NtrC family response regulator